jgi:exopolysaccharide biosynthesis polyprenyl glycosylphosphotransferase
VGSVKVTGCLCRLPDILLEDIVDEVIFAADLGDIPSISRYIQCTEELGISIHIVPDFQLEKIMYQPEAATVFMENFAGLPTMAIATTPQRHTELLIKAVMDYIGAACGLVLLAPFLLLVAAAIKLSSEGPVFFLQKRSGVYGRTFPLIKFRTMVENAEELKKELEQANEVDGPVFKMTNDPRITRVGKFLRKTSLDELPQLMNVLRGEMSLVGPRPPIPSEVAQYKPWQRRRLSMKPGLTCIWQVSGRNNIDFERWMRMDLEYIDNWSLMLDIKILLKTVKEVLCCQGM